VIGHGDAVLRVQAVDAVSHAFEPAALGVIVDELPADAVLGEPR